MKVRVAMYGPLRDADPGAAIELELAADATVADVRDALAAWLAVHAPQLPAGLVARSAFASRDEILADARALPADGELAVLPPVSGG